MSQTPPPVLPYNTPSSGLSREDLREIATRQRAIMICLLVYIIAVFSQFAFPPAIRLLLGLGMISVGIVAAVFIFMLAIKIYSTAAGIVLGLLTLIPILGIIPLLIVNGKATRILRANGLRVGLLGANPADLR